MARDTCKPLIVSDMQISIPACQKIISGLENFAGFFCVQTWLLPAAICTDRGLPVIAIICSSPLQDIPVYLSNHYTLLFFIQYCAILLPMGKVFSVVICLEINALLMSSANDSFTLSIIAIYVSVSQPIDFQMISWGNKIVVSPSQRSINYYENSG